MSSTRLSEGRSEAVPLVLPLDRAGAADGGLVGGKAASLGELIATGAPVPPGFAVTTGAFERTIAAAGLTTDLAAFAARLARGERPEDALLADARARLEAAPLPGDVERAVADGLAALGDDGPVAVRSSGVQEDLEGASFAGLYESYLNVRGAAEVGRAVRRCFASLFGARVMDYLASCRGGDGPLSMGVVVQRMVAADAAGVLFTVNPLTGCDSEMVVEAVLGLGEALVSGAVSPDRFVVHAASGEVRSSSIAPKTTKLVAEGGGGTRALPTTAAEASAPALGPEELGELAAVGGAIGEHFGRPMDVEWVLAGGRLQVVQARPITQITFAEPDEWTTADMRDGGVSSGSCSPFMWSLYELAFEDSFPGYLKEVGLLPPDHRAKWIRMFFARPYWNASEAKKAVEKIPGYVERNFDVDLGIEPRYEGPGKTTSLTLGGAARALPIYFTLQRNYRERLEKNRAFAARFEERKRPFDLPAEELRALDRPTFVERCRRLVTDLYFETETSYFRTIYNTSNSKLDFKKTFEVADRACGGDLSYIKLVGGLQNLSHMRPLKDMHERLAPLAREGRPVDDALVADFAARWRHHGKKELDLRVPRWGDDLPFVRSTLEQALAAWREQDDPEANARRQRAEFEAERDRATRALRWRPLARRRFLARLDLVRQYAWWREEMRDHSTYLYSLVRTWFVEASRRLRAEGALEAEDDVWYLTYAEALELLEGRLAPDEARRRLAWGRRVTRSFRNFRSPNELGVRYAMARTARRAPTGLTHLDGTACSPGQVKARARVVRAIEESDRVQPGEILVAPFTDPGWTPLFARLGGVVTEAGGLLAHAAVISRERGIPAVLAVTDATRVIHDGDLLLVDGSRGFVEILAGEPAAAGAAAGPPAGS